MRDMITIEKPDMTAVVSEYEPLVDQANELVICDMESHAAALEGYKYLKKAIKAIRDHYEPARKSLDTAKKELLASRDKLIAPFERAMQIVNGKVDIYEKEERRKAEEKARVEAEAERKRQEDARIAEAEAAEKAGDDELATEIIERPIEVTPAPAQPETLAKVAGVSSRIVYHASAECARTPA